MMKIFLLAASLLAATAAHAAPPDRMNLVYDLYRNGQRLGQVSDSFVREGDRYTLVSETRAVGALQLFWPGNIRLESSGEMTPAGLRPTQFQHARSDAPHKRAVVRLDWERGRIVWDYRGDIRQESGLEPGTQDQLSQLYQFMFVPKLPENLSQQVISGKNMRLYRYARSDGGALRVPAGEYATQLFERIRGPEDDKTVAVWVAPAHHNLPVQIRVTEGGATMEQRLVSVSPEK
mgnify:CR=1 FL=1